MAYPLNKHTRQQLNQYFSRVAALNGIGVAELTNTFSVEPAPEQSLISAIKQKNDFLKMISIFSPKNAHGEKIGVDVGSIASTTDTKSGKRREPSSVGDLEAIDSYLCTQTNYDVAYEWALLDAWNHEPQFQLMLTALVAESMGNDKLKIGFNGVERVKTSDRVKFPLLQDVNEGWLTKIRKFASEQIFGDEAPITVGKGNEFITLDALVEHAIDEYIAEQFQEDNLVAICGRGILSDKYIPLINREQGATDQINANVLYAGRTLGTLPALKVPFIPKGTILITNPKNLAIYIQEGSTRRLLRDEPEFDRTADYLSQNECFVVQDYRKCALLENITVQHS